jgi:hypothetical protein
MPVISVIGWTAVADADAGDMLVQPLDGNVLVSFEDAPAGDDGFILRAVEFLHVAQGEALSARAIGSTAVAVSAQEANHPGHGGGGG